MTQISPYKISFWLIAILLIGLGVACSLLWAASGLLGLCVLLLLAGISLVIMGLLGPRKKTSGRKARREASCSA